MNNAAGVYISNNGKDSEPYSTLNISGSTFTGTSGKAVYVAGASQVNISGSTISNGSDTAIYVSRAATITIENSEFTGNYAGAIGSCIYSTAAATFYIKHC